MIEKSRQYKPSTIRRLDTLSGNQCAAPNCLRKLIAKDGETIISKICHIEAANENGPRYRIDMRDDERRHFDNLILLCDECHSIIDNRDNELIYPVNLLKIWKKNHESKQFYSINQNPSFLSIAINAIANADFNESSKNQTDFFNVFSPQDKIEYNCIKRNKFLIEDYKVCYSKLNSLYNELEIQGSFKKEKLLRNIQLIYLKIKGKYVENFINTYEVIKNNADNIIEDMEDELFKIVEKENNYYLEDLTLGISIILVDVFIRCKILEEPTIQ